MTSFLVTIRRMNGTTDTLQVRGWSAESVGQYVSDGYPFSKVLSVRERMPRF